MRPRGETNVNFLQSMSGAACQDAPMKQIRILKVLVLISTGAIAIVYAHAQTPATSITTRLEPIAFLTAHEWEAKLPDSPEGEKKKIHARFTWASSRQAVRISNEIVIGGKASPYIEGLYAWDPQQKNIVFWYVDAKGGLTRGIVKVEGSTLVHEFQETESDGKTSEYMAKVTPRGTEAWDNEIFARKAEGLTSLVKVRYEIAQ
jgi:hypothetical protein